MSYDKEKKDEEQNKNDGPSARLVWGGLFLIFLVILLLVTFFYEGITK